MRNQTIKAIYLYSGVISMQSLSILPQIGYEISYLFTDMSEKDGGIQFLDLFSTTIEIAYMH